MKIPRKKLKPYWKAFCAIHDRFYAGVRTLEEEMSKGLGKELEFICVDGDWCGIGSADRKMKLEQFDPI